MSAEYERAIREAGPIGGSERLVAQAAQRRGRDDGWLAVFFEFWAHVVRRPELRERFAKIHARVLEPLVGAMERIVEERGISLPVEARQYTVAVYAMSVGLSLERLTQPEVVDVTLAPQMSASCSRTWHAVTAPRKSGRDPGEDTGWRLRTGEREPGERKSGHEDRVPPPASGGFRGGYAPLARAHPPRALAP